MSEQLSVEHRAILEAAGEIGEVSHVEFAPFVTLIERRKRGARGEWLASSTPYMGVDGRVAMARRDHALQAKRLDIKTEIVAETDSVVRVVAVITSEVYGTVTAYAESRLGGQTVESQHPVEVAETSAVGRALGFLGYGLLPGSGIASAEDMERVAATEAAPAAQSQPHPQSQVQPPADAIITQKGRQYLIDLCAQRDGFTETEASAFLDELCEEQFGTRLAQITMAQAREIKGQLTEQAAPQPMKQPQASGYLDDPTNRRRVLAFMRDNRLSDDPDATIAAWREAGKTREEVEASLDILKADRWRKRYFAGLKEIGVSAEQAKAILGVDHMSELYDENVATVLERVKAATAHA